MSCSVCNQPNTKTGCGKCRNVLYCSKQCQAIDWLKGGHAQLCAIEISDREWNHRMDAIRRNPMSPNLKQIVGPMALTYFRSSVTNTIYLLFGESHDPTPKYAVGPCPDAREYLDLQVYPGGELLFSGTSPEAMDVVRFFYAATQAAEHRKGQRMLDIYFEHQYKTPQLGHRTAFYGGNLYRLEHLFQDCLFDEKKDCGLKHSRVHYVDYRGQIDMYQEFGLKVQGFQGHETMRYDYSSHVVDLLMSFFKDISSLPMFSPIALQIWEIIEYFLRTDRWLNQWLFVMLYSDNVWNGVKLLFPEKWLIDLEQMIQDKSDLLKENAPTTFFSLSLLTNMIRYMRTSPENVSFMNKFRKQVDKLRQENEVLWSLLISHYGLSKNELETKPAFALFESVRSYLKGQAPVGQTAIFKQEIIEPLLNFMDIAALARILRTFDDSGPPGVKMAYVGDAHREAWVKFFTETNLANPKDIITITAEPNKCLDVSKYPKVQRLLQSAIKKR